MKKRVFIKMAIILALTGSLSACLRTRTEISAMHKAQEVTNEQQKQYRQQKAQLDLRFQDIESQLRHMYGRLEQVEQAEKRRAETEHQSYNKGLQDNQQLWDRIRSLEQEIEHLKFQPRVQNKKKRQSAFSHAEEHFANQRWKEAALGFEQYRTQNPKGPNYVLATYKIGVSFEELGERENAKLFYREIIDKYPQHSLHKKASYRLKNLKK